MRRALLFAQLLSVFCFFSFTVGKAQKTLAEGNPSLKGKKILIVYGGWQGHQPKAFVDKIVPWLKAEGAIITLSGSLEIYADKKIMSETDLIIQSWTMDKISAEQSEGLLSSVKNGVGFAGCHGGIGDSFRDNVEYQYMTGGQWVAHPGGKLSYKVNIIAPDDAIAQGIPDFTINTEQYYMLVDPNSKVLASTTFSGHNDFWINGAVIPVAWKKYYANGRVFYLSIGHETQNFDVPEAWELLKRGIIWASESKYGLKEELLYPAYSLKGPTLWVDLIDKNLDMWDIFMGAPHTSTEIEGYEKFDDVTKGTPIGLNKDPKNVFSVFEEDGDNVIRISGEIFAGLVTKKVYENYHLTWQVKWGEKKWEPRLKNTRNSGVLYHSIGNNTDFWNVWMTSLEYEVEETNFGDYISIGAVKAKCPSVKLGNKYIFTPGAEMQEFAWRTGYGSGRCHKPGDPEKAHGEWNTLDLYCYGNTSIHVVNGIVVMAVVDPMTDKNGQWQAMDKGKIQIQSEAAEVFYKNIKIRPIDSLPEKYKKAAGL